jgi:hypothetical protein
MYRDPFDQNLLAGSTLGHINNVRGAAWGRLPSWLLIRLCVGSSSVHLHKHYGPAHAPPEDLASHQPGAIPTSFCLKRDSSRTNVTGRGADQMAGLAGIPRLADLTPVAAEEGAAEGDPRPVYTWEGPSRYGTGVVRSYPPSHGGAPRLVGVLGGGAALGVWDTGIGAFLGAVQGLDTDEDIGTFVTYQRPSDGRPRVAGVYPRGELRIWDGDDFRLLHALGADTDLTHVACLAVYEEPTSGSTRFVSA